MQAPTNLAPHSHTYSRDTCKFSSDSDVLVVSLRRNRDRRASDRLPPRHSSDGGSLAYLSLVLCILGHRMMLNHVGSQVAALSYPVSPEQGNSPLYKSRTFA